MEFVYNNFSGGEVSPLLEGRTDLPEYYSTCRVMENMIPIPQGGAQARPGFSYIASAKSASAPARVQKFVYKKIQGYVLEFGNLYFRIFKDGAAVGAPVEVVTTYVTADIPDLIFVPTWDLLYIFHSSYPTRVISRTSDTAWSIDDVDYVLGPFLTENSTATTLTPSATTGTIDLVSSVDLFDANHVGALFQITHEISETVVAGTLSAVTASSTITRKGIWDLIITGTHESVIKLQRSSDAGSTWYDVRVITHAASMSQIEVNQGEELKDGVQYRVNMTSFVSGEARYDLRFRNSLHNGIVEIATVVDAKNATATVINTLGATTATDRWREGSWSDYRGHPSCGAFFEQRVWHASTTYQPQSIWASQSFKEAGDYSTMKAGVNDNDAMEYRLPIPGIVWIADSDFLLLGTDQGVWKVASTNETDQVTPTNISVRSQNAEGAAALESLKVTNRVVYVGRGLKRVYMLDLLQNKSYQAIDMTELAAHICGSGIVSWDVMQEPYKIVFAVTSDGDLLSMVQTGPEQIGWSRHVTDGDFEYVTILPGNGAEDEVWVTVARTINGSTVRFVERMKSFDWGSASRDAFLCDAGGTTDKGAAVTVTHVGIAATKVTITAAGHGFTSGDNVRFSGLTKSTDLNSGVYSVADETADTFVLKNSDASAYIDSSLFDDETEGTSSGTVEGVVESVAVTHLTGKTLSVAADGVDIGPIAVSSNAIALGGWYNTIHFGLGYTYSLQPQRPEIRLRSGPNQGRLKKVSDVKLRLYKTGAVKIGSSATDVKPVAFADLGDDEVVLLTGDSPGMTHPGGWTDDGTILVQGQSPLPLTVSSIIFSMET